MIESALGIVIMAVLFTAFGLVRHKPGCSGNCAGCSGSCDNWESIDDRG
jgi:hypothetical protein